MTYEPQEHSIAYRVIEFLTTNPDEHLTANDISAKFDCAAKGVHSMLARAVEVGALKREPGEDDELTYSLGTGVPSIAPSKARAPSLGAPSTWAGSPPPPAKGEGRINVDVGTVQIEKNVPLLTSKGRHPIDWPALFSRMEVNDSCVLPRRSRTAVTKAATESKKAGNAVLVVRKISDESIRLWRVK